MPLSFQSISHGNVAFGFFNIESDMLLLEHYFFFSTTFCDQMVNLTKVPAHVPIEAAIAGYSIDNRNEIGDLMDAIHGVHFTGFIGALYRRFPFPQEPQKFKQNPNGNRSQTEVRVIIEAHAQPVEIPITSNHDAPVVSFAEYKFGRTTFHQLLDYIFKGGLPRWKKGCVPQYVLEMKNRVLRCNHPLFKGAIFDQE